MNVRFPAVLKLYEALREVDPRSPAASKRVTETLAAMACGIPGMRPEDLLAAALTSDVDRLCRELSSCSASVHRFRMLLAGQMTQAIQAASSAPSPEAVATLLAPVQQGLFSQEQFDELSRDDGKGSFLIGSGLTSEMEKQILEEHHASLDKTHPLFAVATQLVAELTEAHLRKFGTELRPIRSTHNEGIRHDYENKRIHSFHQDMGTYTIVMGTSLEPQTLLLKPDAPDSVVEEVQSAYLALKSLSREGQEEGYRRFLEQHRALIDQVPAGDIAVFGGSLVHASPYFRRHAVIQIVLMPKGSVHAA